MTQILVVDDDGAIRETIRMLLEDEGYVVFEAPDGKPALTRLKEAAEPMIVLLDLQMPGMDGAKVLEAIANHEHLATRHIYLLVTAQSARTLPLAVANLLPALSVAVVEKPFDVDRLLANVRAAEARLTAEMARVVKRHQPQ